MLRSFDTLRNGIERVMDTHDVLANNLANINTVGFKQSKLAFRDIQEVEIQKLKQQQQGFDPTVTDTQASQRAGSLSLGPAVSQMMIDFSQGDFITTNNKLDFAIKGDGFFTVQGANKEELYTRKGNFVIDAQGYLATTDGNRVINRDTNNPIQMQMDNRVPENIVVQKDGLINYGKEVIGHLKIVDFQNKELLTQADGANFNSNGVKGDVMRNPEIHQGELETSNANAIGTMLKSIEASRSYESMTSVVQQTSDTLKKVIDQTGRF